MHKRITFRHMEHSDHIENHANQQLQKILDFLSNERTPIYVDVVLEPGRTHAHHKVEINIKSPNYQAFYSDEGPAMMQLLDQGIDAVYKKLHAEKKRQIDDRKKEGKIRVE